MASSLPTRSTYSTTSLSKPTHLQPVVFEAFTHDGSNFLEWNNDITTYLSAKDLVGTISLEIAADLHVVCKWQTLLVIRHHLDVSLSQQYIQVQDPTELWSQLQARFHHEKTIFLPQAQNDWINLRVLDFPDFLSFNSELHRITAQL